MCLEPEWRKNTIKPIAFKLTLDIFFHSRQLYIQGFNVKAITFRCNTPS